MIFSTKMEKHVGICYVVFVSGFPVIFAPPRLMLEVLLVQPGLLAAQNASETSD